MPEQIYEGEIIEDGVLLQPSDPNAEPLEELPNVPPQNLPPQNQPPANQNQSAPQNQTQQPTLLDSTTSLRAVPQTVAANASSTAPPAPAQASIAKIKWEKLGLSKPEAKPQATQATIRVVNHVE
jgi:hypothetical protein